MELKTVAGIVRFAAKLESDSAAFYESAAGRWESLADRFVGFAKENTKHTRSVRRIYYSVISDALEACFPVGGLSTESYPVASEPDGKMTLQEALAGAIRQEAAIHEFFDKAGAGVEAHIGDITRVFKRVARAHDNRKSKLEAMHSGCVESA